MKKSASIDNYYIPKYPFKYLIKDNITIIVILAGLIL